MMKESLITSAFIICILAGSAVGQSLSTAKTRDDSTAKRSCFRGRPLAQCRTFWITEFGYSHRFDQQSDPDSSGSSNYYFTWELGRMVNLNTQTALGGTLFVGADEHGWRIGIKPRYRRWLNQTISFDLSTGILIAGGNSELEAKFPGFTGHLGLSFGDWLALTGQMEIMRLETAGTDVAWYGGLKVGSHAGRIGGVLFLIIAAIAVASI